MKYSIDRIINNTAILENIKDGTKIEVDITLLPPSIHDGTIITYKDGQYTIDKTEEEIRRQLILERFNKLKHND